MFLSRCALVLLFLSFGIQNSFAASISPGKLSSRISLSNKSASDFEDASLRNIRLIQEKQSLQMDVEEINSQRRARVSADPVADDTSTDTAVLMNVFEALAVSNAEADLIYNEIIYNQLASPLALVVSYTGQTGLQNQGFTYDQALAGIAMLQQGDSASASKILDFFKTQWDGTGLSTVYNTQVLNGWTIESDKILGPNAWIALLAIHYYEQTGDAAALDFATQIAKWAMSLPHISGGVAMGEVGTDWAERYSVENNLSYYSALQLLAAQAANQLDRDAFSMERDQLKAWLTHPGYDATGGLFRRGAYLDSLKALDTNTWGILALGVSGLQDIGVNVDALVAATEREFMVSRIGDSDIYGGNVFTSKGFDFSYSTNAFLTYGRTAVKWVEGTNQMITAYRVLADYYTNIAPNPLQADLYTARADYFAGLNATNRITTTGGVSYAYADIVDVQAFYDVPSWRTAGGPSIASSCWVYFSLYGFNPFV